MAHVAFSKEIPTETSNGMHQRNLTERLATSEQSMLCMLCLPGSDEVIYLLFSSGIIGVI